MSGTERLRVFEYPRARKFWRLGRYRYPSSRWVFEGLCYKQLSSCHTKVLDVGCGGEGGSIRQLHPESIYVGLDVNKNNLSKSKRLRPNAHFVSASAAQLPFKKGIFDLVVFTSVLEHIEDKSSVFHEFARVCTESGSVVGTTTNPLNPAFFLDNYFGRIVKPLISKFGGEHHYERHGRLGPSKIASQLNQSGFVTTLYFVPYPFDKITTHAALRIMKEVIVFKGVKEN